MTIKLLNIERGMPTVDQAMQQLQMGLATMRRSGIKQVKVIHGYGSSGQGGGIKLATRDFLKRQLTSKRIRAFCPGDQFGPFDPAGRQLIAQAPQLKKDQDWGRQNAGITIVLI